MLAHESVSVSVVREMMQTVSASTHLILHFLFQPAMAHFGDCFPHEPSCRPEQAHTHTCIHTHTHADTHAQTHPQKHTCVSIANTAHTEAAVALCAPTPAAVKRAAGTVGEGEGGGGPGLAGVV